MKVCVWTDSDRFAGTEKHCLELACGLRDRGMTVLLGCRENSPLHSKAAAAELDWVSLDASRYPMTCLGTLQELFRSGRVELLHTHNGVTTALGCLARRAVGCGRLVATQHFISPARTRRRGMSGRMINRVQGWNERSVSRWIAVSLAVRDAMLGRGEARPESVSVVRNGVRGPGGGERGREEARRILGMEEDELVLVCAARLEEEKGHGTLLNALAMVKAERVPFRAFFLGEGVLRDTLEARTRELELGDEVRFMGHQACVEDWIRAADVSLLASPREPFGLVLLEAMSRAVPVVAADSGGPREILQGEAGVLFNPGDARDLARKLWNMCCDPERRMRIGRAGQERWRQNYTERHMIDSMLEAYQIAHKTDDLGG